METTEVIHDSAIMDGTIDDLFGEAANGLDVSLPSPPPPAALVLRIAELQDRGCCTKLAWSSSGSIASISQDGKRIAFRALVRDKNTRTWVLGDETKTPIFAPEGTSFVHIQFSGVGVDLAAVDNLGAFHMYTLFAPLGKMHPAAGNLALEDRNRHQTEEVVGMQWLPLFPAESRAPHIDHAHKVGDRWEATTRQRDQVAARPHHPADGKHALVYVTRSARVCLLYQNEGHVWQSTSLDFSPMTCSTNFISHAALGEHGADLLLVTHDLAARFRLYRLSISWNSSTQTRAPNMSYTLVAPSLSVMPLGEVENVAAKHADLAGLTHLRILPAVPAFMTPDAPNLPTILAVFSRAAITNEATEPMSSFSVISRWHVQPVLPALHESLKKLKTGGELPILAKPTAWLQRQPDITTSKIILSMSTQNFDTLIAFAASDGSVDLRERLTMNSIDALYTDMASVSTLQQCGFEHLQGEHHVHVALSADTSALVYMRTDNKLRAQSMVLRHGWQTLEDGISDNKPFIEAAAVCVARQFALLLYHKITSDETLALVPPDVSSDVRSLVVKMIFRMINRSPDISMQEIQKQQLMVLGEPLVPRVLSAQLALGTDPASGQRNSAAQFAFVVLNLRSMGTVLAQTMSRAQPAPPEVVLSLCGLVRWSTDLCIFIVDTLQNIWQAVNSSSSSVQQAFQQLMSCTGNPALHLLLSSFSRALLRFQILWLGKYFQTLQAAIPRARSANERHQLTELLELPSKAPFSLSQFEHMVAELDSSVRNAYTQSGLSADRRTELEIAMITDGVIPTELEACVTLLIETLLPKLCENMDLDRLYFWQTDWLGLASSTPPNGARRYDAIRKIPLTSNMLLRHCRRCGSEMEDVTHEKLRESPGWFTHAHKHCVCTNYWLPA